jgi:hypothetical protein
MCNITGSHLSARELGDLMLQSLTQSVSEAPAQGSTDSKIQAELLSNQDPKTSHPQPAPSNSHFSHISGITSIALPSAAPHTSIAQGLLHCIAFCNMDWGSVRAICLTWDLSPVDSEAHRVLYSDLADHGTCLDESSKAVFGLMALARMWVSLRSRSQLTAMDSDEPRTQNRLNNLYWLHYGYIANATLHCRVVNS